MARTGSRHIHTEACRHARSHIHNNTHAPVEPAGWAWGDGTCLPAQSFRLSLSPGSKHYDFSLGAVHFKPFPNEL